MIAVPGHPTSGPFYLVKGLLNAATRFPWQPASPHKLTVYIRLIPLLAAFGQPNLPFHVPGVESNDVLYNSADEYLAELATVTNETVQSALALLKEIGEAGNAVVEASLALQLAQEVGLPPVPRYRDHGHPNRCRFVFVDCAVLGFERQDGSPRGTALAACQAAG